MSGRWDALRGLEFPENYPSGEATDALVDEMLFQRACQVVSWSLPAISMWAMKQGSEKVFGSVTSLPTCDGGSSASAWSRWPS